MTDAPFEVTIRPVRPEDYPVFFANRLDPEAIRMVAFMPPPPADLATLAAHWERILANPDNTARAILVDGQTVGYISCWPVEGEFEVGYWLDRVWWGRGIASRALALMLEVVTARPLGARVAHDNHASRRALEKNGFVVTGSERSFAEARGAEIEELILSLPA